MMNPFHTKIPQTHTISYYTWLPDTQLIVISHNKAIIRDYGSKIFISKFSR